MESNSDAGIIISNWHWSVVVTLSLVALWFAWLYYNSSHSNSRLPPGPRGLPLLGNLLSLDPELHSYFAGLAHTHGPVYKLRLVITSPSLARHVLKDHDVIFANHDVPRRRPSRHVRKVCVLQMLSKTTLDSVHGLHREQVRRTVGFFYSRVGSPVNVGERMFLNTLNVVTNMLWGGTVREEAAGAGVEREFRQVILEIRELLAKPNVSDFIRVWPGLTCKAW